MKERRKTCRGCGAEGSDDVLISKRGWCLDCGVQRSREAILDMAHGTESETLDRWREGLVRAAGYEPVD